MIFGRVPQQPLSSLALAFCTTEADVAASFAVQFSQGNFHWCELLSSPPTVVLANDASRLPALSGAGAASFAARLDACPALNDNFLSVELRATLQKAPSGVCHGIWRHRESGLVEYS